MRAERSAERDVGHVKGVVPLRLHAPEEAKQVQESQPT